MIVSAGALTLWIGVGLVLLVMVRRWRLGVWDIEAEGGPPSPGVWDLVLVLAGLVLTGWGAFMLLAAVP